MPAIVTVLKEVVHPGGRAGRYLKRIRDGYSVGNLNAIRDLVVVFQAGQHSGLF
jgi:hypothetical protein